MFVKLMGPLGAGKTTLIDLMLGIDKSNTGVVKLANMTFIIIIEFIRLYSTYNLLDDTIATNIAFGEEVVDYEKIQKVIDQVQLRDFIATLENGTNTIIGEVGVRLSGIQCQRIGRARALYNNPKILVLDETISVLDS